MLVRLIRIVLCLVGTAAGIPAAVAREDSATLAGLHVTVWSPDHDTQGPLPVIVFSHGFHGCAVQSRFLTNALASVGYLVVAPNHRDAACGGGTARWSDRPEEPFGDPAAWTEATFRNRADDIRRLVAALKTDATWRARADANRLGLMGHSLGGYTVLGLGGAWPGWKLEGVRAVLAMSPYALPFTRRGTLRGLAAPVMYQGGTRDTPLTPTVRDPMGAYDQSASPRYYVEFDRAGHFAWTDLLSGSHAPIVAYAGAFMDRYVKGLAATTALTQISPDAVILRYTSELGTASIRR